MQNDPLIVPPNGGAENQSFRKIFYTSFKFKFNAIKINRRKYNNQI